MAHVAEGSAVRRQLVLTQQFSGRKQLAAHDAASRLVEGADSRQAILVVDCQERFRGDIRIVQQVGAVAGDQDLAVVRAFAERGEQHACGCGVQGHLRLLQADQVRWQAAPASSCGLEDGQ